MKRGKLGCRKLYSVCSRIVLLGIRWQNRCLRVAWGSIRSLLCNRCHSDDACACTAAAIAAAVHAAGAFRQDMEK